MPPKKGGAAGGGGGGGGQSKKKKKPISTRGYATTSVPAKVIAVEPPPAEEVEEEVKEEKPVEEGKKEEELTPEKKEREELQGLAERIRSGCDKDIARMIKTYEFEKRVAKSYPFYPWTDQDLQKRVLALALTSSDSEKPEPIENESEERVIARIVTLFGVLEQLGFTRERIEDCLRVVRTLEVDDCLDWLFLHCDADDLSGAAQTITPPQESSTVPSTPRTESSFTLTTTTSTTLATTTNSNGGGTSPPRTRAAQDLDDKSIIASLRSILPSGILSCSRPSPSADDAASDSEEDLNEDTNLIFARFKLQMSEITRAQGAAKRSIGKNAPSEVVEEEVKKREKQIGWLKKRLKIIEGEYTFQKDVAEKLYREERVKLDAAQLSERLNASKIEETPLESRDPVERTTNGNEDAKEETTDTPAPDTTVPATPSAENDDGEEGGFFGKLLDELPTTSTNDTGSTIPVLDYSLPKSFSGKTPRTNLEETIRKRDRSATISFSILPGSTPRAVRASCTIHWSSASRRTDFLEMQDAACGDKTQAWNYVSTLALFEVGKSQEWRTLPPKFRDLWDELGREKKEREEERYREALKAYKVIALERMAIEGEKEQKGSKLNTIDPVPIEDARERLQNGDSDIYDRIRQELYLRQQWPSYQDMLRQRATLPIAAYRSHITKTIEENQCVVLCGETGCGKSTQVPSFMLENEMRQGRDVKIYCTEPRRISAISLAQRVSAELGEQQGQCGGRNSLVGYSIRLDARVSASSRIVYATTGIVLRMLEGKDSLSDVTHIVLDEVHERSIDSDFLLIILKEILAVRRDLKVILMSATVDAEKIADYMGGCPVINVPGRTFPVTPVFLEDVVELTQYQLDAKSDSSYVSKRVRNHGRRPTEVDDTADDEDGDGDSTSSLQASATYSKQTRLTLECMDQHAINFDLILMLLEQICFFREDLINFSAATLIFLPSLESIRKLSDLLESHPIFGSDQFLVLPLHSTISNENQGLVFNIPPPGIRKIVLATNIAETGVTIPDITCVIDSGMHREMRFDEKRQISRLVQTFVAQSNAKQRRGRAGRVQEGICFHLFTRQRYDDYMAPHPQPEMMRLSLQDLALRIKILKIGDSIEGVLLKALDPPTSINIQRAIAALIEARALTTTEDITPLGRHLAKFPMDVHLGKFLILSCLFNCLDAALTIVATLNSKSPWVTPFGRESEADAVKKGFKVEQSDFLTTYNAYCCWRNACGNGYDREFTRKSFLSQQTLQQIEELRQQYFSFLVDAGFIPISESEKRDLLSTRYGRSRTRFVRVPPELDTHTADAKTIMAVLSAALYPKLLTVDPVNGSLKTLSNSAPASIHPSSVNFAPGRRQDWGGSKFLTFFTAMHTKKLYVWESGTVDERAVYLLCGTSADFHLPAHALSIDRDRKSVV